MNKKKINELREIFCKTFPNTTIPKNIEKMKIGDLDEWDSLGNLNLLLAVEEFFNVKFDVEQMSNIKSVSDIINNLDNY